MTEFMYEVVCTKNLNFNRKFESYNEAYGSAQEHLADAPVVYQVEIDRNDFGECTAVGGKEVVWRPEPAVDELSGEDEDNYFEDLAKNLGINNTEDEEEAVAISSPADAELEFDTEDAEQPAVPVEYNEPMFFIEEVEQKSEDECSTCEDTSCTCKNGELTEEYSSTIKADTAVDAAYDFIYVVGVDAFITEITAGLTSDELEDLVDSLIKDFDCEDCINTSDTTTDNLDYLLDTVGSNSIADAVIKYLSTDKLADLLTFIFKQYDYQSSYLEEGCTVQHEEINYNKLREELEENEDEVECQECGELCPKDACTFNEAKHGYVCNNCAKPLTEDKAADEAIIKSGVLPYKKCSKCQCDGFYGGNLNINCKYYGYDPLYEYSCALKNEMRARNIQPKYMDDINDNKETEPKSEEAINWIYADKEYGCYKQLADGNLVRISRQEYRELKASGVKLWKKSDDEGAITSQMEESFKNFNEANSRHFFELCEKAGINTLGDLKQYMLDNNLTEDTLIAFLEKATGINKSLN